MLATSVFTLMAKLPYGMRKWLAYRLHNLQCLGPAFTKGVLTIGRNRLKFSIADEFQSFMLLRCYEPELALLIGRWLKPGDTYVDIGAQLGYTAALAAEQVGTQGSIVLIEPDPRAREQLIRNHSSSVADGTAIILPCACSDRAGDEVLLRLAPVLGHSAIETDPCLDCQTVTVLTNTLAAIRSELRLAAIDLLKIDVEGHEVSVLRGALPLLESKVVKLVWVEANFVSLKEQGLSPLHIHAIMTMHGYLGCSQDGTPLGADAVTSTYFDNFCYFVDIEDYKRVFQTTYILPEPFPRDKLEAAYKEAILPLPVEARQAIRTARGGNLAEALARGEAVLAAYPLENFFRGHLAFWYSEVGDTASARKHLKRIIIDEPQNQPAKELLGRLNS